MQYSGSFRILAYVRHLKLDIDNQTLVEECRNGDKDAMSILYSRFAPRMMHVITRYVSDRDSTQDILHDGFIAAFTRLDTLRDPERLDFWLATIMKNLSLKYLQAQNVSSILEEIPETAEEPELDEILDFATLESLIRQLPEGYQNVFRLAVLEGKSHKEISEILGIAPNSSSSQLFHAKIRLRQLIRDYQLRAGLISMLLLLVSSGIFFLARHEDTLLTSDHLSADSMQKKQTAPTGGQPKQTCKSSPEEPVSTFHTKSSHASMSSIQTMAAVEEKASDDNISDNSLKQEVSTLYGFKSDSVGVSTPSKPESQPKQTIEVDFGNHQDQLFAELQHKANTDKGWSAGISVDPGMLSFNGMNGGYLDDYCQPPQNSEQPPSEPEEDDNNTSPPSKMPRSMQGIESYLGSASRRHYLPLSFALTAEKRFASWLGLESGIVYSYLHTDFERYSSNGSDIATCHWHYLELPLKVNLYAYTSPRIKLYFGLGGRVAIPVYSYAQIAPNPYCQSGRFDSKAIWSVGGSVGASFRLSKRVDLFIEPSLRYHFPQDCEIPNIWTDDEPWSISIPIGFRFNW